jgi:hypothetical protein
MRLDIERVGDSVVLKIDHVTVMLDRGVATELGLGLMRISALGADALDDPRPEPKRLF